jgi:hypothetical protein
VDSRRHLVLQVLLLIVAATSHAAESPPSREEVIAELTKRLPPGTVSNGRTFEVNGFHIESSRYRQVDTDFKPNGDEFQSVTVEAPDLFMISIDKGVPPTNRHGVGLFHRDSGTTLMSVSDENGDGALDFIQYSRVDAAGKVVMTVIDYEADGQADFRMNVVEQYNEMWQVDRWYKIEKRDGKTGITINGKFTEVQREKNRYVVP